MILLMDSARVKLLKLSEEYFDVFFEIMQRVLSIIKNPAPSGRGMTGKNILIFAAASGGE